jgi:hypothetical protein
MCFVTRDGDDVAERAFAVNIVRVHLSAIGVWFKVLMCRNLFCVLSTDSEEAFWADL